MATITQNNIQFTNVKADTVYKRGGKYTHGSNANGNTFDNTIPGDEIAKSLNALEIDWNGAKIDEDYTINDTGELMSLIKTLLQRIQTLETGMVTISNALVQQLANESI